MAAVKNPINVITCFRSVIIKVKMTKMLPHFPAALNQTGITLEPLKIADLPRNNLIVKND